MSATNRGAVRVEADFYPTPESAFRPLIPYLPREDRIWEPAWGDKRLVNWMLKAGIPAWGGDLNDPERPLDFLKDITPRYCNVTNPPFSLAFRFCKHSVANAAHTFMLLRLSFLGAQARRDWFRKNEPSALFVLSERPSFVMSVKCAVKCGYKAMLPIESARPRVCPGCGKAVRISTSDAADYAWFYFGDMHKGIYHL